MKIVHEGAVCYFDHIGQRLYPLFVWFGEKSLQVDHDVWIQHRKIHDAVPYMHIGWMPEPVVNTVMRSVPVPYVEPDLIPKGIADFIYANWQVANAASKLAETNDYEHGQSFKTLVINATPFAPESFPALQRVLGFDECQVMDSCFHLSSIRYDPEWAISQAHYPLDHMPRGSKIWIVADNDRDMGELQSSLKQLPIRTLIGEKDFIVCPLIVKTPF
jgi:hypothetical protein